MAENRSLPQDGTLQESYDNALEESKQSFQNTPDVGLSEQPGSEQVNKVDNLPDGGYGWVCVVCVALVNAHTWGINSVKICLVSCNWPTTLLTL